MSEQNNKLITVIRLKNPFNVKQFDQENLEWDAGKTVHDYLPEDVLANNLDADKVTFVVSVNGKVVKKEEFETTYLNADDYVVVCPVPGKGGKSIFGFIAMIAVAIVAPQMGFQIASAMEGAGMGAAGGSLWASTAELGSFIGSAISFVGKMVVSSLFSDNASNNANNSSNLDSSPSYGYDGPKNVSAEGIPVPVIYGQFRVGGNLVDAYVENATVDSVDTQFLYMLYCVSEGEISGINDLKVNDQPYTNFKDVTYEVREGTASQSIIGWFNDTYTPRTVGQKLTTSFGNFTTLSSVDKLRFDVVLPNGLFGIDTGSGNTVSRSVELQLAYRLQGTTTWIALGDNSVVDHYERRYKINGVIYTTLPAGYYDGKVLNSSTSTNGWGSPLNSGWGVKQYNDNSVYKKNTNYYVGFGINTNQYDVAGSAYDQPFYKTVVSITAATKSAVRRSYITPVLTPGIYETRFMRSVAESTANNIVDVCYINEINEITTDDVQYNNTALLGVRVKMSDQLSGLPKITYLVNGIKIRRWNATDSVWETATSSNPAWVVLDMLTNERYGAGVSDGRIDMDMFNEWAKHCETYNLTFNGVFDTSMNLWSAMQYVLRAGHAQIVMVGTRITVAIDRADSPMMMFSVANMVQGSFQITWLPMSDRANEIEVNYFDVMDDYKQRAIKLYDSIAVTAGAPVKSTSVTLYGVTDAQRASSEALLILNMNRYITQSVQFDAPMEAISCTIGDLIYVQHDMPQWGYAGRLEAGSTASVLKLDRPMPMTSGKSYRAMVLHDYLLRFSGAITAITGNSITLSGFDGSSNIKRLQVITNNLLKYSEGFENSAWSNTGALIVTNAIVAPDGSLTAEKLIKASTTSFHFVSQTAPTGLVTLSCYMKAAELTTGTLFLTQSGNYGGTYDLVTGVATASGAGNTASMVSVGNGWWRCILTQTANSSAGCRVGPGDGALASSAGNGTSGIYVWGAMLNSGSTALPYTPTIDREVTTVFGSGGTFGVVVTDATGISLGQSYRLYDTDVLEERDVVNSATGEFSSITLQSPFTVAPPQFAHFMFGETTKMKKPFRVRSISGNGDYIRTINAFEYNASVFDYNDTTNYATPNYSALNSALSHSTITSVKESLYRLGNSFGSHVTITFANSSASYKNSRVKMSRNGGAFQDVGLDISQVTVTAADGEILAFKVIAYDALGISMPESSSPTTTYTVIGKTAPPAQVQNFVVTVNPVDITLTWDANTDIDLAGYEIRTGISWSSGTVLVTGLAANRFSDDKSTAGTYYYHIKAIDTSGNYSANVTTATMVLTAPATVNNFNCVPNGDRIEFRWDANPEQNIVGYELREGGTWGSSTFITIINGTSYSLAGGSASGTRTFWIKAIAAPGIYSDIADFTNTSVAQPTDRNIVVTDDERALSWAGSKYNVTPIAGDLVLDSGKTYGEYTFQVSLPATYNARNTMIQTFDAVIADTQTWATSTYTWASASATRHWVFSGDLSSVNVDYYISKYVGLDSTYVDGISLNSTTTTEGALAAATAVGVAYSTGRFLNGALISDFTTLDWNVTIPSTNNITFWYIPSATLVGKSVIASVTTSTGGFLWVGYDATLGQFYLESHLGQKLTVTYTVAAGDRILIGIVQTATERRLFVGNLQTAPAQSVGSYTPIGAFSSFKLHQ